MPKILCLCAFGYAGAVWVGQAMGTSAETARMVLLLSLFLVGITLVSRRFVVFGLLFLATATGLCAQADLWAVQSSPALAELLRSGPAHDPLIVSAIVEEEGKPVAAGVQLQVALLSIQRSDGQGGCLSQPLELTLQLFTPPSSPILPGDIIRLRTVLHQSPLLHRADAVKAETRLTQRTTPLFAFSGADPVRLPDEALGNCRAPWGLKLHGFFRRPLSSWRQRLLAKIHRIPSPTESRAVLAALTLGVRGALLSVDRERTAEKRPTLSSEFADAGIAHILSVSGLHLALVGWLFYRALAALLLHSAWLSQRWVVRRLAAALTIPLAIGYTALTGAELPTIRATCVLGLWLLATMLGKRTMLSHGLALSVLVIGAPFPVGGARRLCEPSWLLSMAATLGISYLRPIGRCSPLLAFGTRRPMLAQPLKWLWSALDATLGATIATAPLVALFFGRFVATGIVANLVLVPIGELLVLPLGLLGLAIGSVTDWFSDPLLRLALAATSLLVRLTALFAEHRLVLPVPAPPLVWLVLFALGTTLWICRRPSGRVLCALALVGYVVDWQRPKTDLRLTALSVGQGDALVVEFPKKQVMVIDAGPASGEGHDAGLSTVAPFLRRRGISRIDWLVMTHAHPDHSGGIPTLLREFSVTELWIAPLPCPAKDAATVSQAHELKAAEEVIAQLRQIAADRNTNVVAPHDLSVGKVAVEAHAATAIPDSPSGQSLNNGSVVLTLRYGGRTLLLTGDIESEREAEMLTSGRLGQVDVLKAPHHCSKTSSTDPFVQQTRPRYVICSVGRDNRFGFPHAPVMQRYQAVKSEILRTDEQGSLMITASENGELTAGSALDLRFFF